MIENFETARATLKEAFEASRVLDQSIHAVIASGTPDEVTAYKRAVGSVMAEILFQIINPILTQHPELTPPGWPCEMRGRS